MNLTIAEILNSTSGKLIHGNANTPITQIATDSRTLKAGDLFIALTTSGNSKNLVCAVRAAQERGLITVGFLGKTGGTLKGRCDFEWIVSGFDYSDRIQEAHMSAIHIIIEMVERELFVVTEEVGVESVGVV